jgi:hypothetical protein
MVCIVGFTAALFLSGMVSFAEDQETSWSMWYLFGGAFLMALAGVAGLRPWSLRTSKLVPLVEKERAKTNQLGISIGMLAVLSGVVSSAAYIKAGLGVDMEANRSMFQTGGMEVSVYWRTMGPLMPFGVFATVMLILYFEEIGVFGRLVLGVGILVAVMPTTIFLAGREYVVNEIITVFWCCAYRKLVGRRFFPNALTFRIGGAVLLMVLASAMVLLSVSRTSKANHSQFALESTEKLITPNEDVLNVIEKLPPGLAVICTDAVTYTPSACVVFDRAVTSWRMRPDYFRVFFPMIQRRFSALGWLPDPVVQDDHFEALGLENGFFASFWPTTAFQMARSFGILSGFFASILVSYLTGLLFRDALERNAFTSICLSAIFFLFFSFWLATTIFQMPMYEYGMYWLFILAICQLLARQRARLKTAHYRKYIGHQVMEVRPRN